MNSLRQYIVEKFQVDKDYTRQYAYSPKDKYELIDCIKEKIKKEGLGTKDKPLDLNDIDTSKITNMNDLFNVADGILKKLSKNGYFDISDWNVSNVESMAAMFKGSEFNGDISDWDVSNVEDFCWMFAHSVFNGDISKWNVKSLKYKTCAFLNSPLQKNPPKWYHA